VSSDVDISNAALSHLGARAQVAAISPPDGSVEAGYCARFYPLARRELIEQHAWSFARARATLAEVDNPSTVWAYAYARPSDCIKPLRVLALSAVEASALTGPLDLYSDYPGAVLDQLFSERGSMAFEVEGDVILTNEPEAVLLYRSDVTDTSKFSPMFATSCAMLLASYLAGPIIKGLDGAKVGAQWRQTAEAVAGRAITSNANAASETAAFVPSHLAAR
jgi:hypothetical protein